tara:strand:- start:311 stop:745 length:435 start_codon:yes stop_codon:yes gene_type:complete
LKDTQDNNLAFKNPDLAKEWHPTKNGDLKPTDVTPGSNQKVWWQCLKNPEHEWKTIVKNRANGSGCPYCAGRKVGEDNNLAVKQPKLAEEWHPTKNGALKPIEVTPGSHMKVWWMCGQGHEWETTVGSRTKGTGCPLCSGKKKR